MTGSLPHRPVVIDPTLFDAVIFDMDGVVTDTARTHAAAWTRLFDEYLTTVASPGTDTSPFTAADYRAHVDGRARIDGVETFLASRGIDLARGTREDPPGDATAWALANRKNSYFLDALDQTNPAGPVPVVGRPRRSPPDSRGGRRGGHRQRQPGRGAGRRRPHRPVRRPRRRP
ncbi:hypothetical protein BH20ACT3_BH20ACT3_00120 [soil metagenome]